MEKMEGGGAAVETKEKRRDIRRFYCEFCGICRSKKSLIEAHLQTHHKDEIEKKGTDEKEDEKSSNTCEECGASFQKPAHLKQHMQSHSLERPFTCPVNDCHSSYRRKDHLNRHLLQHQGKLFPCPVEGCTQRFAYKGNIKRHIEDMHEDEGPSSSDSQSQKQHICQENGCGKVFKYASKLRKHEESHVKLESVEAICCEPDCMKYFANNDCLKAHVRACHLHVLCEVCGTKQLKKNMKRHMRGHENEGTTERVKCSFKGCECTFATKSNVNQHVKSAHLELRPFACRFPGCDQKFSFKHVRDNHEKSGSHVYIHGDFVEADEQFQSRQRGGRKRACPTVETLLRKRVVPPGHADSVLDHCSEYLEWLLSAE